MIYSFIQRRFGLALFSALSLALVIAHFPALALDDPSPQIVRIPAQAAGVEWQVHTQVFKPQGEGPFPVIIFSHGRAPNEEDRKALEYPVLRGHVSYWLRKGFAVVAPIRPGYGATGGADIENSGVRIGNNGECGGRPAFERAIGNSADVVSAVLTWTRQQAWVSNKKIVLVGQSVGGLTSVAVAARKPAGVVGYINFAGGAGGNPTKRPGKSCFPEALTELYRTYGGTTKIPNLWLYAPNDQFWGADTPKLWHAAFAKAGGTGRFIQTAPVPDEDGHKLLAKGGRLWSDHVNPFVDSLGFKGQAARR